MFYSAFAYETGVLLLCYTMYEQYTNTYYFNSQLTLWYIFLKQKLSILLKEIMLNRTARDTFTCLSIKFVSHQKYQLTTTTYELLKL